jgi:hypothetical protein
MELALFFLAAFFQSSPRVPLYCDVAIVELSSKVRLPEASASIAGPLNTSVNPHIIIPVVERASEEGTSLH